MKFNTNDKEKDHPSDTHDFKITSTDIWMGQLVREYTLQPELITLLNTEIDRRKDHPKWNEYLAGNIKDQYNLYFHDGGEKMQQTISESFVNVIKTLAKDYLDSLPVLESYSSTLTSIWYNDQKKHEYNPIHAHTGVTGMGITGVMYLKVPEGINAGTPIKSFFQGQSPNGRTHIFGNISSQLCRRSIAPSLKEGMFYIFPFDLQHLVYPFEANVVRRSLSFNMSITALKFVVS